jgi:hypothetical protein
VKARRFATDRARTSLRDFGSVRSERADQQNEERAIRVAKGLAPKHAGVIAWSREARPDIGEYGPPTPLFVSGDVPDME